MRFQLYHANILKLLEGTIFEWFLILISKKNFLWGWLCSRQSVFQDLSKFVTARFSFIPCQISLDGVVTTQTEGWLRKSLGWKRSPLERCGRHCEHIGLRHTICIRLRCLLKKRLTVHCEFRNVASNGEFTSSQMLWSLIPAVWYPGQLSQKLPSLRHGPYKSSSRMQGLQSECPCSVMWCAWS